MSSPKYPHVNVQLTGQDGNAFMIIGLVKRALKNEVGQQAADEFQAASFACGSYDELLQLAMSTVEVS